MNEKHEELLKEYKIIPQSIWDTQLRLIEAQQELETAFDDLEMLKSAIYLDVCNQKNESGKLLYSNEKTRENANKQAMMTSSEYKKLYNNYSITKYKVANLNADLERWRNKLKVITHSIDFLASVQGNEK